MRNRACCVAIVAASMFGVLLSQDGQAVLKGRVTDTSGAVLQAVSLLLVNDSTGHQFQTTSRETGDYVFPFVPAGAYTLHATLAGFAPVKMRGIRIVAQQPRELPLRLNVGGPRDEVIVSTEANRIETSSAAIRYVVTQKEIEDLPLVISPAGRSVLYQLTMMVPGASNADPLKVRPAGTISINGSPLGGIGYRFDGIENSLLGNTGVFGNFGSGPLSPGPNPDALGEFSAVTHNFNAESGVHPVQVNLQTRSGGNRFRGQLRLVHMNPDLSARDFFDTGRKTAYTTTAFGWQISGPVIIPGLYSGRSKTFFFLDQETTRSLLRQMQNTGVVSDAERTGDFSSYAQSLWPKDPQTGQLFPGGRIPAGRIHPTSRIYLDRVIARATSGILRRDEYREEQSGAQVTSRIDHQFSSADKLNVTFFFNQGGYRENYYWTRDVVVEAPVRTHNLALQYTHSFSSSVTSSLSFGRSLRKHENLEQGGLGKADLSAAGFVLPRELQRETVPSVTIDSRIWVPAGGEARWRMTDAPWSFKKELAVSRSIHALKTGFEMRWQRASYFDALYTGPSFSFSSFNPHGTGNDVADFLLGLPNSYSESDISRNSPRREHVSMYFQDDLRVRPGLALNLGLRYERAGSWTLREKRQVVFRPGVRSNAFPNAPAGALFTGDLDPITGEILRGELNKVDGNNFAPRIGVAFSPSSKKGVTGRLLGDRRTSFRAGYGIYYVFSRPNSIAHLADIPPWFTSFSADATQIAQAGGSFTDPLGSLVPITALPLEQRQFRLPLQRISFTQHDIREPYQQQWTLSIQRQLGSAMVAEVAYVGNRALHIHRKQQLNPAKLTSNATFGNVQSRRSYPEFGSILTWVPDGKSAHHALQAMLNRRFASRVQFNAHYVWSKTLENTGSPNLFAIVFADRDMTDWARANSDRRHQVVFNGVIELPAVPLRLTRAVLSGWQANTLIQIRSGSPYNIRNPNDPTLRGLDIGTPDLVGPIRRLNPRQVRAFTLPNGRTVTGNFAFDPTAFRIVNPGNASQARQGTLGRNVVNAPGEASVDLSLLKRVRFREHQRVEIRADFSNLLNHAQFGIAFPGQMVVNNPFFGQVRKTSGARRVQFVLKYGF